MKLYSKNGSIPKDHTDGTEDWVEVPEPPVPGPGEETVWWCPPGWVVRPVEPEPVDGYVWKWSQSEEQWVSYATAVDGYVWKWSQSEEQLFSYATAPAPAPTPPPPPSPNGTITTDQSISGNVTI